MTRVARLTTPVALCLLLTACQTTASGGIDVSTGCIAFRPISWSKKDTRPTQEEIVSHNAVWKKLCKKG